MSPNRGTNFGDFEMHDISHTQTADLFGSILESSRKVDTWYQELPLEGLMSVRIRFPVPAFHPRHRVLSEYVMDCGPFDPRSCIDFSRELRVVLISDSVLRFDFVRQALDGQDVCVFGLTSTEHEVKTLAYLEAFIQRNNLDTWNSRQVLVVAGGGILLNIGSYLAERMQCNLILYPTTALAMADGSGGKVRVNAISHGRSYKHFYKSFYEPNAMRIDPRFLSSLPVFQKRCGMVEIIKHALFQSAALYEFLSNKAEMILKDDWLLLKAILWAADLKRICLEIDVEENENGSRRILRGGHTFSDRLEEEVDFRIPHGFAVAIGILMEMEDSSNQEAVEKAKFIFERFGIPTSIESYWEFADIR